MGFGERLSKLRKKRGLSQYDLADRLQMTRGQIANYEQGKREPDFETLSRLSDFFEVSTDYLINGQEPLPANITNEEVEFLKWVETNVDGTFFYDFDTAPEERKEQFMADMRYLWEREKKTKR